MHGLILGLLAALSCAYALNYLRRSYRHQTLASPDSLYAALALQHFFVPALLLGIGIAPGFVNGRNEDFALAAAAFAFLGLVAVQVGTIYGLRAKSIRFYRQKTDGRHEIKWNSTRLLAVVVILLLIGWLSRLYVIANDAYFQIDRTSQGQLEGPFYAAIRMVELFPLNVLCILAIRYWRTDPGSSRSWGRALWFTATVEVLYWLPSGRKEPIVLAIVLPLLIRYLRTGQLPSYRVVLVAVGFIAALFPMAFAYRYMLEVGGIWDVVGDPAAVVGLLLDGDSGHGRTTGEIVFGRMSLLEPLAACVRALDEGIWRPILGESYVSALLGLVPRFLWAEKPDFHYGNEFGYITGFVSTKDTATSISVTFFGESYLNFGIGGLVPLTIIGLIFGLIYKQTRVSRRSETALLVYAIMLPTVLYIGGTFALYFGGLLKTLPFYYLIGRFMESGVLRSRRSVET